MIAKRFFQWTLVAACVMGLSFCVSSCTEKFDGSAGSVSVVVNNAAFYDKLGITDLVAKSLSRKKMVIDSVLVYDQKGLLVARLGTGNTTLQTETIGLGDLPKGSYTLVAWQTTSDGIWAEPFWLLLDADQLATVRFVQLYPSTISAIRAVGMYSTTVTIGSESVTIQADIEPVGSIVDLQVDGLTSECDYEVASLVVGGEGPAVDGFYLDPARSGEDRWVFSDSRKECDRSVVGVMPSMTDNKAFTFSHGENKAFVLYATNKTTNKRDLLIDAAFTLVPGTVATFYYNLDKIGYQPPYCGPTADFAEWKAQRDAGILDIAPCIQWGANLQTVHDHVASHHQWYKFDAELVADEGHGWGRWYHAANNLFEYYCFETEDGNNLIASFCICTDTTDESLEAAWKTLEHQGYELKGGINYPDQPDVFYYLLLSADGKTEACLNMYKEGGWQINYQLTNPDDLARVIPVAG